MSYFKYVVLVIIIINLADHPVICRRGGSGGGRQRSTARTTRRPQATPETFQQNNNYQVGNLPPSAPVSHPQTNPNPAIGFDNVNRQSANNQPIGFDNVQNRVLPQNNQPPSSFNNGFHPTQQQPGGYNPQVHQPAQGIPQQPQVGGYNPQGQQPPGTWNHQTHGYNPAGPQFGGYTPHGGGYNPYLAQPGSYYNNYATQGIQPQFYQPPQQSSSFGAGSLLGYAGSFGGGYLIGKLTSGGGGHDHKDAKENPSNEKNEQQFVVHHYYHNANEIPKQITVANNSIATCNVNGTQNLCVPNTFPMCLTNGTIMCVTHTRFTVPCGTNTSMACIVTALPCNGKDKSCNSISNLSSTVVYIPCISNVTILGQTESSLGNDLCITAIAEPVKKLQSPIPSLINLMSVASATLPYELQQFMNTSTYVNTSAITPDIKTEMPPALVSAS